MRVNWLALALCGIVVCAAVVSAAEAKAKAKADKADAKTEVKTKEAPKERKGLKDWQKMNDAAYRELEDAWMDDEEEDPDEVMPTKWVKGPDGKRQPPMPRGPKMEMGFATLQPGTTKDQCEALAIAWSQLLSTGAVSVKAYSIEDDKILLGVDGGYPDMFKVKDFVLDQKETVEFEWQQQKFKPTRGTGAGGKAKPTKADREAQAKLDREAELRRKVESGELFKDKNMAAAKAAKAKAKAKAADAKGKAKVKAKAKANAKDAKAAKPTAKKAASKPAAEQKKDSAKPAAKKPKDDL